jgi:hypothetical protein
VLRPVLHRPARLPRVDHDRPARKQPSRNFATNFNALGFVLEVDCAALQGSRGPIFGVVGETVVAGKLPIRLERVGRPEIKNVIMFMKGFDQVNRDLEIRDSITWKTPST